MQLFTVYPSQLGPDWGQYVQDLIALFALNAPLVQETCAKVVVEQGDMVCFRTGFAELLLEMKKQPDRDVLSNTTSALDGRDPRLLQWITDTGLVALFADNYAVEANPARACMDAYCATLPLHAHCLFKLGVYLGEMWYFTQLADWLRANGRNRFLLTAPPLRLPGAVGSPATPVATV